MANHLLLKSRQQYVLKLPKVLENLGSLCFSANGRHLSASNDESEVKVLFPETYGKPVLKVDSSSLKEVFPLRVGVILSGGQAAGGHNVIIGIHDALKKMHADSAVIGFLNGPGGLVDGRYEILDHKKLDPYRNTGGFDLIGAGRTKIETEDQFQKSLKVATDLKLDGIVMIGGDDSNTNAALLAEYFIAQGSNVKVVGVPKTIDGDLQNEFVEISFGFDTACKVYAEMIGNLARDSMSAKKYTHFVKLMGRTASHIALECALKTHPNLTLIGEEVLSKKQTLEQVTQNITDVIMKRSEAGKDYGVILIPEGLIEFIPEVRDLIAELNQHLIDPKLASLEAELLFQKIKGSLSHASLKTFNFLPRAIQEQLLLDRDPHGNIKVSQINTEQLFIDTVKVELKKRGAKGSFSPVNHFFGYEGRAGFPSNFDATYCYALGFTAAALLQGGYTGYMACISDLCQDVTKWSVWGLPLTRLMHLELRKGKQKPVIAKALVDLQGKAFQYFKKHRDEWMLGDHYEFPGPIQFLGDPELVDQRPITMVLDRT